MATEAEKVVVELLAKVDGFDGKIKQSASSFGNEMKRVETTAAKAESAAAKSMDGVAASTAKAGKAANAAGKEWVKASSEAGKLRIAQLAQASAAERAAASTELATRATARAAQSSRLLGYQISDIGVQLSAGTSPFLILAQQGPQVANALDGTKGKLGAFATFLSGPWGAALFGATTVLGVFGSKLFEAGESVDDLVEKLKEQARKTADSERAQELFGKTTEGVTEALKDNRKALDELKGAQDTAAEAGLARAMQQAAEQLAIQTTTQRLLEQARAREEVARSLGVQPGTDPAAAAFSQSQAASRVSRLEGLIAEGRKNIEEARRQVAEARSFVSVERGTASKEDQITRRYEKRIEDARKLAVAQGKVGAELEKQVRTLANARDAEIKRAQEAERTRKKTRADTDELSRFINPVGSGPISGSFGENRGGRRHAGIDIAVPVGTGVKAAAAGTVITAGTLLGYGNVVIVDHGGGTTTRYAHLSSILAQRGQSVGQGDVIGLSGGARGAPGSGNSRGPHLHYEVRSGERAVDPRAGSYRTDALAAAEKAEEDAAKLAQQELERKQRVANEEAGLDDRILALKTRLANSAEADAALELQRIQSAQDQFKAELDTLVAIGKVTDAEAYILQLKSEQASDLQRQIVEQQKQTRLRQDALTLAQGLIDVDLEALRDQADLATTQKERRRLALQILDAETEKLRLALEDVIASEQATEAQKEIARRRLSQLDARKADAAEGVRRDTQAPFESYIDEISLTGDELNEQFEMIAANGLRSLTDGLADAIVNFRSLGDVARAVLREILAALIRIVIQQLILKALGAVGFGGGGSVGGPSVPGTSLPGIYSRGGRVGYPTGGLIVGPGTETSDSIPAITMSGRPIRVSDGEYIIKGASVRKLGVHTLDQINATGMLPIGYAAGGSLNMGPANASASAGSRGGTAVLSPDAVRQLEGVVFRAAQAMPDVKLFPTLDPATVLRAALNSPGGQRAMFDFVTNNPGQFNSSLSR